MLTLVVDVPKMREVDINFAVTIVLHALLPPSKHMSSAGSGMTSARIPQVALQDEFSRHASILSHKRPVNPPREILQTVAFLGKCSKFCQNDLL